MIFSARNYLPLALCIVLASIASCGKDSPTQPVPQTPARITLSVNEATLTSVGQTIQLTASVLDQESKVITGAVVTWTSSNPSVVKVDAEGLATALTNGNVQITAASGGVSTSASIIVAQASSRIEVMPSSSTLSAIGETVQLTYTVYDSNGEPIPGAGVSWSSGDVSVATVSANGLVTAVGNGNTQVTATSGSITASATVTVAQSAGGILISSMTATLNALGETVQLSATVLDANGQPIPGAEVTWTSSDLAVALVDRAGLVTARGNGVAQITARSGGVTQSMTIIVSQSAGNLTIEPSSATLSAIGETVQLSATVYDANNDLISDAEVSWSSNNPGIVTVTSNGLVMAVGNGSTEITAESGGASARVMVTVTQSVGRISLTPSVATLSALDETVQLSAKIFDTNDQEIPGASVMWSSSETTVARVNLDGLVTAVGNGSADITAVAGTVSENVTVKVNQKAADIDLSPASATLTTTGGTVRISATVRDANSRIITNASVNWSSSNVSVATVSSSGVVRAVANGNVRIQATSGSVSKSISVTVEIDYTAYERNILVQFYNSTDGPNWTNNTNWLSDLPLDEWNGIRLNADRRVVSIYLGSNGLNGTIPSSIGQLTELGTLWLNGNQLTGAIPISIGNLSKLDDLDLSSNQLTGNIPSSFGNLDNLVELLLQTNQLTGTIPSSFGRMSKLGLLELDNNQLTGNIPSSMSQGRIAFLSVGNNMLSGPFPSFLGRHRWLQELNLRLNEDLTGPLPLGLAITAVIPHLRALDVSGTQLCAPAEEAFQTWLSTIDFRGNDCSP